eukprot:1140710-Pelagomonas_calceolata.AAC.8
MKRKAKMWAVQPKEQSQLFQSLIMSNRTLWTSSLLHQGKQTGGVSFLERVIQEGAECFQVIFDLMVHQHQKRPDH